MTIEGAVEVADGPRARVAVGIEAGTALVLGPLAMAVVVGGLAGGTGEPRSRDEGFLEITLEFGVGLIKGFEDFL